MYFIFAIFALILLGMSIISFVDSYKPPETRCASSMYPQDLMFNVVALVTIFISMILLYTAYICVNTAIDDYDDKLEDNGQIKTDYWKRQDA